MLAATVFNDDHKISKYCRTEIIGNQCDQSKRKKELFWDRPVMVLI